MVLYLLSSWDLWARESFAGENSFEYLFPIGKLVFLWSIILSLKLSCENCMADMFFLMVGEPSLAPPSVDFR